MDHSSSADGDSDRGGGPTTGSSVAADVGGSPGGGGPTLYDDPAVYDILETPGTAREVDVLARIAARLGGGASAGGAAGAATTTWFEPACGTGRYLRVAATRGRRVIGCDTSAAMLRYARRRFAGLGVARRARVFVADMGDPAALVAGAGAAAVDFAFIPVNTIRLLAGDAPVLAHLAGVARVLRRGAVYVVGISLDEGVVALPSEDVREGVRGRCRVQQVVNYLPPAETGRGRRETVISHLTIRRPRGVEHRDHRYELRTYSARQWQELIGRSALRPLASLDHAGRPRAGRILAYQLEVLVKR